MLALAEVKRVVGQLKLRRLIGRRQDPVEKRAAPRKQGPLAAKVALGVTTADCTIRDISDSGAQLHAPSVLRLPGEVYLLVMGEGLVVHARRVWARFPLCGLKFLSVVEIDKSTHPQAAPLKEAWADWCAHQQDQQ